MIISYFAPNKNKSKSGIAKRMLLSSVPCRIKAFKEPTDKNYKTFFKIEKKGVSD